MLEDTYIPGRYPAIVRSYDQKSRTCRLEIPGLTDGGDVFPKAEIEYPIGDKSRDGEFTTEIEILPGDTVWIAFICGDKRYPIITGYRNPLSGNSVDWRRVHHENMEMLSNVLMNLIAGGNITIQSSANITIQASESITIESGSTITVKAPEGILLDTPITTFTGNIAIQGNGSTSAVVDGDMTVSGDMIVQGAVTDSGGNTNNHSH